LFTARTGGIAAIASSPGVTSVGAPIVGLGEVPPLQPVRAKMPGHMSRSARTAVRETRRPVCPEFGRCMRSEGKIIHR
jgi:hypothetical protein